MKIRVEFSRKIWCLAGILVVVKYVLENAKVSGKAINKETVELNFENRLEESDLEKLRRILGMKVLVETIT